MCKRFHLHLVSGVVSPWFLQLKSVPEVDAVTGMSSIKHKHLNILGIFMQIFHLTSEEHPPKWLPAAGKNKSHPYTWLVLQFVSQNEDSTDTDEA